MGKHRFQFICQAALCAALFIALPARAGANDAGPQPILLRVGAVDLADRPSLLDSRESIVPGGDYLIQLDGPMTPARRDALAKTGAVLGDYFPQNAWRVDLDEARLYALSNLEFVVWLGAFDPAWKLSPELNAARRFETRERRVLARRGLKRVVVHLAVDCDESGLQRTVAQCGGRIVGADRDGRARRVTIDVSADHLDQFCALEEVRFIEEAPESAPRNSTTAWIAQSNIPDVTSIWDQGLHGEGQLIGLIDWDVDENHCAFFDDAPFGDTHRKFQSYYGFDQNTLFGWHGTHVAGVLLGDPTDPLADVNLTGMAFAARLVFQDQAATITATNLGARLAIAHDDGARVHSNSWGATFDNSYNAWAHDIDEFTFNNEDDIVLFAVINGGASNPILSPENAKNCLAIGACGDVGMQDELGSGGIGPTLDGRQKPEVWIPGCTSNSALFGAACGVVERSCATSWAAPAASGMATLVRQYFTDGFYPTGEANAADVMTPSGALLKAILINSAVDMSGFEGYFGPHEGWGRILLDDALYFAGESRHLLVRDVRHADGLNTGASDAFDFDVAGTDEPLKITLVWNDAPATIGTSFAPVNNLDLIVTAPDGSMYLGNHFVDTESQTGGSADALNNAEQVHRLMPMKGTWSVEVFGAAVNVGTQGFAVAVTGDLAPAGGPESDLSVAFSESQPWTGAPGDEIELKLSVTNMGPDAAPNVAIEYAVPVGLTLMTPGGLPSECAANAASLSCLFNSIAANDTVSVGILLHVEQAGSYTTVASAASDALDPAPDDNAAEFITDPPPMPELEVVSIVGPAELFRATAGDYQVTLRNNGDAAESMPTLTHALGAGLTLDSINGCLDMPNESTCALAALSAGDDVVLIYTIRAPSDTTGPLDAVFIAGGIDGDSDANNNTRGFTISVIADSDGDGVLDGDDVCPGFDDGIDADADGTPDGCDQCPDDPAKVDEGICGCGVAETDDDGDGVPNCGDLCPQDPDKVAPGECGCGASDEDTNDNGVPDCLDTPVPMMPGDEMPPDMMPDLPADQPFRLEDLDPCLVRYLLQSFFGIPLCGPCISFAALGTFAGLTTMRRRIRTRLRRRR